MGHALAVSGCRARETGTQLESAAQAPGQTNRDPVSVPKAIRAIRRTFPVEVDASGLGMLSADRDCPARCKQVVNRSQ
jgi:hypothetical protein